MRAQSRGLAARVRAGLVSALMLVSGAAAADGAFVPVGEVIEGPHGARTLCRTHDWACRRGGAPLTEVQIAMAREVSLAVNRTVPQITDQEQYGRIEVWALPTARGGDCEDVVLLKKRALVARGLPADRLLIASVLDRQWNAHAILVLRTARGDLVLDSLTDRILGWRETGYLFVTMQHPDDPRRWAEVPAQG